jgi:hypothetical protein
MVKTGFCSFTALFYANSNDWMKKAIPLPGKEFTHGIFITLKTSQEAAG